MAEVDGSTQRHGGRAKIGSRGVLRALTMAVCGYRQSCNNGALIEAGDCSPGLNDAIRIDGRTVGYTEHLWREVGAVFCLYQ